MKIHHLYKITIHINSKGYIGQTTDPRDRFNQHIKQSKKEKPSMIINRAMKKHCFTDGYFDPTKCTFEVIACCLTQEDANALEELLIIQENTHIRNKRGYNVSNGGSVAPKTEEWKRKISQKLMGHGTTQEAREKISRANLGKIISEEVKQKVSKRHKGRVKSEIERKNLSIALMGNKNCLGKQNAKGFRWTEEEKQKMSERSKGIPKIKFTEEQIDNIIAQYNNNLSMDDIAVQYNCSKNPIIRIITQSIAEGKLVKREQIRTEKQKMNVDKAHKALMGTTWIIIDGERIYSEKPQIQILHSKICSRCKIDKDISAFSFSKNGRGGYYSMCKECKKECDHLQYKKQKQRVKDDL